MKLKLQVKSARVKGISFHPSKPWIISSLHSGLIQIWDYNMKICVSTFEGHDGPVRGVDFHPQLPLFVSGGDDGLVKVWDYKQKRCMFSMKGHIDYIRSTFFHHELPWVLSACDDQTMRIWNYQSRACVNIITGHSHYVMCAQFHYEKNFIVSCSLDSTVRIWDFSVLRKKLTQTKNPSSFIGVEIECIKVLDGHERGCNWVCFHPSQNLIASCSDDRKIKLWKYTNQVAWEHSTLPGHKNNVSSVVFDQKSSSLISNSEDRTLRIWNYDTKAILQTQKRESDRYWMLRLTKNGNLLAAGHDSGLEIFELNKQIVPHGLIGSGIVVFAKGMKTLMYDIEKNVQKEELYQYTPKDKNALTFINRIIVNQFDSSTFMVQVNENEEKVFMVKKKESYLNFPNVRKQYEALDSCFISKTHVANLASPKEIHLQRFEGVEEKNKILRLSDKLEILRLFSSNHESQLIISTKEAVLKYDLKGGKVVGQANIELGSDIRQVVLGKDKIALCGKNVLLITTLELQTLATIHQTFSIQSAYWQKDNLLFYTTKNHWKYALINGETGVLKTLEQPLHLVRKLTDRKFLAFNVTKKVFEVQYPEYQDVDFKLAVLNKEWVKVDDMVKNKLGKQKKSLVSYLVSKGYASAAVDLADTPEEKFALAVQASNFQLAFQICSQINTLEYWKMLGEQALKQGVYEAYELASQKQKQYDRLNFLYSLQHNKPKLEKLMKLANKLNNKILAFNSAIFLNNQQEQQQILRDCGLEALAQLSQEANSGDLSNRLKSLKSSKLQPINPEGELDFSNWHHNEQEQA